jgi:polysulfide reductase chain C
MGLNNSQNNPVINSRFFKTQHEWGWQVVLYLYLAGMGAGSLAIGLLMDWLGVSPYEIRTVLLWGPVLVAFGALFLVMKLGIKRRFLNTILNPKTSWLSRGFYILSVCIVVGGLVMLISLLPIFDIDLARFSTLLIMLDVVAFIFALGTAVYTGILIMSVKYVSFWNTWLLPALFTVSALSTGSMALVLVTSGYDIILSQESFSNNMMHLLLNIEQVFIAIEAIVLVVYIITRYKAGGQGKNSVLVLLFGKYKFIFWLGIVVCGFILPIILENLYSNSHDNIVLLFASGVSVLAAGLFLRMGTVYAGIKDQTPLQKYIEVQYFLKTPGKKIDALFDVTKSSKEESE